MIQWKQKLDLQNENANLAIAIFDHEQHPIFNQLDEMLDNQLSSMLKDELISVKYKENTPIYTLGKIKSKKIILVGLGKKEEFDLEKFRNALGKLAKETQEDLNILIETFMTPKTSLEDLATVGAEGITLARYKFEDYKTEPSTQKKVTFSLVSEQNVEANIKKGKIYAEATNHARKLYTQPGNKLTATDLANELVSFAKEFNLEYRVLEKDDMEHFKMGGILGVNRGSTEPPKMIVINYQGAGECEDTTALVGKGLTFDTGGYCLKPRTSMNGMQGDMGGAASAFGAFEAAVRLQLPVNLMLVIPATDNMVSADAIKPGDVLHMMSGKTVEVTNTDAEGRLILADAITFAKKSGASRIINLATLTGAIIVALGDETTGAFTNSQEFYNQLAKAAECTHENIWQMPLYPRDQKSLRTSLVADLNNSPVGKPGAIMAAAFLKEFVEDTPWIHLDIAGTSETKANHDLGPKGATGAMVRTLVKYLETTV